MTEKDPFHHLHDEAYAEIYATGLAGAAGYVPIGGRPVVDLCGDWKLTLDLFDEGLRQRWFALDEDPPSQWAIPRDYEIDAGETVPVPSCWNVLKPEWTHFEGAGWYTRHFDWRCGSTGERVVLNLGGGNYRTLVFLNGIPAGGHLGGSTPFTLDVTALLREGRNRIQVMVENRRHPVRVPMHHVDWFNYGGLYREISLMRLPPVFIRHAVAHLAPGGRTLRLAIELSAPVDGTARVAIEDLGVAAEIAVVGGRGGIDLPFEGKPWSPGCPTLYDVVFEAAGDIVRERIGFRTVETRDTEILLNGEPIWLRGVCVHEDDLSLGKVSTEADVRRRFRDALDLGCNFLRLAHYPHHEHVARIADEMGLLLWAEIPVYWAIAFEDPASYADADNQLRELILRDRNRASVILWGVGNENADTDARLSYMARLAAAARSLDDTRLIGAACLINRDSFAIEDRLAAHLDVIGVNEYFGWYEPDFSNLDRLFANSTVDRPVIVSETGADASPGHRGAGRVLFTEDWQAEFHRQQFRRIRACPYVAGMAAWLLYDFRSERRQTGFQKGFNRKGLVAEDKRTRKLAFGALAACYRS